MSTRPGIWTVLRDTASWVLGALIIFKQAGIGFEPPPQPSESLIWMGAVLVGVPGALQILVARFGQSTPTDVQPPSSASPASGPSSSGER